MTTSPNKRYSAALIRHFILIALFFPAFYTKFQHVYYQDMSFMSIIALMMSIHVLFKCRLDFHRHKYTVPVLSGVLVLYLATAFINYRRYPVMFWRSEPLNILIAVVFFLSLLLIRQESDIVSDKVIRFTMVAMLVHNIIGIIYRLAGGSKFYMQTFYYEATQISETNRLFSWMYYDAAEYALILLLTMAFFMTYKRMFKKTYLYWGAQGVFILCMLLTNVSIYYLATALLFGGDFLHSLLRKNDRLQRYLPYTYPVVTLLFGGGIFLLTRLIESLQTKALIWKATWDILRETPEGFYVGFGVLSYSGLGVDIPVVQAQNTFLNHMLRHSLGTGLVFTLLVATILILAFLKKPNYRSLGILLAILLPLNLDFGLQTLHLPYVLFLIYCIFFRRGDAPSSCKETRQMRPNIIPKRVAPALLKHVVAVSLFIPYFYCKDDNYYYQNFILANFFAILTMVFIFTSWKLDLKKNGILLTGMGILLIAYNVCATYMNYNYHHWYGEQINTTISFLFFMVLLMVKDPHALIDQSTIRSIIHMMVTTNVLAIGYRLITGQNRILFMNNYVRRDIYEEIYSAQYSWLYMHKSQYALILVLCIAFCVVYRKFFRNPLTYFLSLGILIFALYLSDSYTSMGAVSLIFIGLFLDYLWKAKWWKKIVAAIAIGVPGTIVVMKLLEMIRINRSLLTLGGRILIWKNAWKNIINNPNGMIDFIMGLDKFAYNVHPKGWPMKTYNCHNVFLNQIFRYSIPVGGIFTLLFVLILMFLFKRNFSFTALFFVFAITLPLCMDYSLTCAETTFLLTIIYVMFFRKHLTGSFQT